MSDKIQNAYESSKNIYDDVLTQGNIFSKLYIKLFWSGTNDNDIAQKVLSYIPDDFSGKLLDVPVGTAVFTQYKWIALKDAHITSVDFEVIINPKETYEVHALAKSKAFMNPDHERIIITVFLDISNMVMLKKL